MRMLEKSGAEGVRDRRGLVSEDAGQEAYDAVHDDHRRQFAARQHIIADRELVGYQMLTDALIIPFIMAADEDQMLLLRQLLSDALRIRDALRAHEDDARLYRLPCDQIFDRQEDRFRLQHHASSAPVGVIIHRPMFVRRVFAEVHCIDLYGAFSNRFADDALGQEAREHLRKQRQDIDPHVRSNLPSDVSSPVYSAHRLP